MELYQKESSEVTIKCKQFRMNRIEKFIFRFTVALAKIKLWFISRTLIATFFPKIFYRRFMVDFTRSLLSLGFCRLHRWQVIVKLAAVFSLTLALSLTYSPLSAFRFELCSSSLRIPSTQLFIFSIRSCHRLYWYVAFSFCSLLGCVRSFEIDVRANSVGIPLVNVLIQFRFRYERMLRPCSIVDSIHFLFPWEILLGPPVGRRKLFSFPIILFRLLVDPE